MKVQRTIPPAAALLYWRDLLYGLVGFFLGEKSIQKFEAEIKEYFGVKYVFTVSSGKAALTLILRGLKSLSEKKEVIIPAYTCFSVPSSIVKAGLKVSLCDIDLSTFDYDYKLLEDTLTPDTLCVISNHLFGIPSDVDRINSVCQSRGVFVIEDAAQAMGGQYKGRKIGTCGDVGFISLGRGKNITCGSGGIIVTNSKRIAEAIRQIYEKLEYPGTVDALKEYFQLVMMALFIRPPLYWFPSGLSFLQLGKTFFYKDFPVKKFSPLKAEFLRNWRDRLVDSNKVRSETSKYFSKTLQTMTGKCNPVPYLRFPFLVKSAEERNRIYSLSENHGLGLSLAYPTAINEIEEIKTNFKGKSFPSAKEIANKLLTLPTHHFVSEKDKKKICEIVRTTPGLSGNSHENEYDEKTMEGPPVFCPAVIPAEAGIQKDLDAGCHGYDSLNES